MKKTQEEAAHELFTALEAAGIAIDYASSDGGGFRITDGDEADYIVLLVRYSEWRYHVNYVSNVPNRLDEPIARLNDAADVAALLKSRIERAAHTHAEGSYALAALEVAERLAEQAKRTGVPVTIDLPDRVVPPPIIRASDLIIPPDSLWIRLNEEDV